MTNNRMGLGMDRKCSKHSEIELQVHPFKITASEPPKPCYYCPECEPSVKQFTDRQKERHKQSIGNSDVHKTHKIYITPSEQRALSDERLELFISHPLDNGLTRGEQMELARELLVYRKASKQVVAYIGVNMLADMRDESRQSGRVWINDIGAGECIPLYAVPPLQAVTVPDEMTPEMMRAVQLNSELGAYATSNLCGAYSLFDEFWRVACRAAMLKSVTNEP